MCMSTRALHYTTRTMILMTPACSVYPLIDPEPHFAGKTFKGKVVLIAGGSAGIGMWLLAGDEGELEY